MGQVVKMDLADGGSVLVEVAPAVAAPDPDRPVTRGGRTDDLVTSAGASLEQALDQLGPIVKGVVTKLREAADWPDEVEVEFSISLSADANVIIARTSGEANFKISLHWTRDRA